MTNELTMTANSRLEFAYGRVLPGEEKWMAEDYFGTMGATMAAHGFERLVGAGVLETNVVGMSPVMAVFCAWPSAAHRAAFLAEPGFVAIKPERDKRLDMSDGHLFEPIDEIISLSTESDYAIVLAEEANTPKDPIFALPLAADSHEQTFDAKFVSLLPWGNAADDLIKLDPETATVFRVRFEGA